VQLGLDACGEHAVGGDGGWRHVVKERRVKHPAKIKDNVFQTNTQKLKKQKKKKKKIMKSRTSVKRKKILSTMSSFQSDDSIEEPPAMPLRHSTGGDEEDEFTFNPYHQQQGAAALMATTYSVDESVNEKGEKRTSQRRRSSDREATPDTANTSSNTTSNNNNNRDNDDDDDNNDTANISSDDDNNNNNNNNSNTGTMPARGNVLESAASLKWSTGEILPGGEHANSRSADQAFDATGSFFPVGSEQAQQQRSSSTASAGDLRRAAVESGGGPASWIIDAHEIQFNKEIGRGSFGAVYTAKLRGSDVAVKKLYSSTSDADILADFSQEVSIMTKLRHPHVLLFLGQFEHKREVFFFFFFFVLSPYSSLRCLP
jgi:hypothetical protein